MLRLSVPAAVATVYNVPYRLRKCACAHRNDIEGIVAIRDAPAADREPPGGPGLGG
jgi:hypothetical protein